MDDAQRRVTVFHCVHDDADSEEIVHLIQRLVLVHHLLVDAEEVLHPSVHLCLDVGILHMLRHLGDDLLNEFLTLGLSGIQVLHKLIIDFRLVVFQGQIVELCLDLRNTQPLSNGRVDVHRLSCLFLLLLRGHELQRPHIVEPVRQLDDDHPDVLRHRQEHLP